MNKLNITNPFTVEEENLICVYGASGRDALISDIRAALPDYDEPEMRDIAESALKKLEAMTNAEFSALTLSPAYDDETEG
jgi:hypothetical protein